MKNMNGLWFVMLGLVLVVTALAGGRSGDVTAADSTPFLSSGDSYPTSTWVNCRLDPTMTGELSMADASPGLDNPPDGTGEPGNETGYGE